SDQVQVRNLSKPNPSNHPKPKTNLSQRYYTSSSESEPSSTSNHTHQAPQKKLDKNLISSS
ncbi:uncharacterized protein MELLADRAFT_70572, partial [Melampsora larici-populina 98AG31]